MAYKTQYLVYIGKVKTFTKDNKMILEWKLFIAHSRTMETIVDLELLDEHFDVRNIQSKYLKEAYSWVLVWDIATLKGKVKNIKVICITRDWLNWFYIPQD